MKALEMATQQICPNGEDGAEGSAPEDLGDEVHSQQRDRANLQKQQVDALVHVDEKSLCGEAARCTCDKPVKSDLPIETIRRLSCDAGVVVVTEDEKGNPLNVGRKHRMVQPTLRRALASRDKSCRYPSCSHEKWLDAHHVMHWADGGETSLSNTILLCSRHHRLPHEGGYRINKNPSGEWQFVRG